jgi:anti-sigma factor RsiW
MTRSAASRPGATPPASEPGAAAAADPAPIGCETAVRRLWDYLDGGLAAPRHREVEAHLATCAACPPHFAFAARTLDVLAAARPDAPSPDEQAALRVRVRAALNAAT